MRTARNMRACVPLGIHQQAFPTRALVRKARMVLSNTASLRTHSVPLCARAVPMRHVMGTRWWKRVAARMDVRGGEGEWDVDSVFAVGCSRAFEDAYSSNDGEALRALDSLESLADEQCLFMHTHNAQGVPTGTPLPVRVVWSSVRRDGHSAWVVLAPRA